MELQHAYNDNLDVPDSFIFANNIFPEYSEAMPATPTVEDKRRYNLQYKGTFKYNETTGYSLWYPNYWYHAYNLKTEPLDIAGRRAQGIMLNNEPFIRPEQMIGIAMRPLVITGVELKDNTVTNWFPTYESGIANRVVPIEQIFYHRYTRQRENAIGVNSLYDVTGIKGEILEKPYFSAEEPDWGRVLCDISGEYIVDEPDVARISYAHNDEGGSLFPGDWGSRLSMGPIDTKDAFQNPSVPQTYVNRLQLYSASSLEVPDIDGGIKTYVENGQIYAVQYTFGQASFISAIDKKLWPRYNTAGSPKCGMLHITAELPSATNRRNVIAMGNMIRFCRTERLI